MKPNKNKMNVTKENGELFETVFGEDMKGENVKYINKKEHIIKSMIDGSETPLGLKMVSSIFGYLQTFFTFFLPIALMVAVCIDGLTVYPKFTFTHPSIVAILTVLLISVVSFCVLKIVEFLLSAFMIWIYSTVITNAAGRSAVLQERIREHLKTEDMKNRAKDDTSSMNPEDSPEAMSKTVNRLVDIFYASKEGEIEVPERNYVTRIIMNILFNIYKEGYKGRLDIPLNLALNGLQDGDKTFGTDIVSFVLAIADSSDWFTKPF